MIATETIRRQEINVESLHESNADRSSQSGFMDCD